MLFKTVRLGSPTHHTLSRCYTVPKAGNRSITFLIAQDGLSMQSALSMRAHVAFCFGWKLPPCTTHVPNNLAHIMCKISLEIYPKISWLLWIIFKKQCVCIYIYKCVYLSLSVLEIPTPLSKKNKLALVSSGTLKSLTSSRGNPQKLSPHEMQVTFAVLLFFNCAAKSPTHTWDANTA